MNKEAPSTGAVLATLIGVTWRRLLRGRAVWVVVAIALLPLVLAIGFKGHNEVHDVTAGVELLVMALLPSVLVASAIGEDIEDRTTTYLWSRPLSRWTVVVGKLLALAPLTAVLVAGGWFLAIRTGAVEPPSLQSTLAFGAGALAASAVAAGCALLVPRNGTALSIIYLVIVDLAIGAIPASLQSISLTRQVTLLAGLHRSSTIAEPAITLTIIAAVWLTIGLLRLRRLES